MKPPKNDTAPDVLHDPAAEAALLSCIILDPSLLSPISQQVGPETLARLEHRIVFEALRDCVEEHGAADLVLLNRRLTDTGQLAEVGGPDALVAIAQAAPHTENWRHYCAIVRDFHQRRILLRAVREALNVAGDIERPAAEVIAEVRELFNGQLDYSTGGLKVLDANAVEAEDIAWLWPDRIPAGMYSMLVGNGSAGKSFLTSSIIATATTGRDWPDGAPGSDSMDALLVVDEESVSRIVVPRLRRQGADMSRVKIIRAQDNPGFNVADHLYQLRAYLETHPGVRLVAVDPITAYLGDTNQNNNSEVRVILTGLAALAERLGVAVIGLSHFNKRIDVGMEYRTLGATSFSAVSRVVWGVCAKDDDDDSIDPPDRFMFPIKQNILPPGVGPLRFRIIDGVVTFQGHASRDEVRGAQDGGGLKAEATEAAMDWLRNRLKDNGDVAAAAVIDQAEQQGISKSTLHRAADRLGVVKTRLKTGDKLCSFWHLS